MKLLFVNTVDVNTPVEVMFPPLGLAYIASYLRTKLPGTEIKIVYHNLEQEIKDFKPDLLAISSVSQNFNAAAQHARTAKAYGLPVIIGGPHITSIPTSLTPEMDLAVLGEGEETMLEIVQTIGASGWSASALEQIKGVAYRRNHTVETTGPRAEISSLDTLPFPARDLLPIPHRGIVHLFSSRGCPYKCQFCASTHFWGKVRFFSAEYVLKEIEQVVATYDPIAIGFYDDLFIASKKRLFEIVELIVQKGYHRRLEFVLNGRANLITHEVAAALKRMNVVRVNMGLESGNEKTLEFLKGETASVDINARALEILKQHGINAHGTFIIGCPGETSQDISETETFIRKSSLSSFEVYLLTPLPGTPVWYLALSRGVVSNDMDWSKLAQEPKSLDNSKIVLADSVPREVLYDHYRRLQRLKKIRRLHSRIITALKHPGRIIPAILKNLPCK